MYIVKWTLRGLTKRHFLVEDRRRVLRLLIAGQMQGYRVRVEQTDERVVIASS